MINKIKKNYFVIIIILLLVLFLPKTLMMPALTNSRAIITGISIDKKEDEFSLALQLITPQSNISNNENLEIVDDTGSSLYECFNNLSIKLGKVVGLEHVNIIILSDSLVDEDIMNLFDYLYRNTKISLSTIIVQTNNEAKKLLESSAELNNNSSSSLQNNLGFSNELIETPNVTTLGNFFNDYYSFSSVSLLPYIETPEEKSEGGASSDSQGSGESGEQSSGSSGGSSSGGSPVQPLVKNNGESSVYKKGKLIGKITKEISSGFTWVKSKNLKGIVKVENVSDNKFYSNSTVVLDVQNTEKNIKYYVKNNMLNLDVNIDVYCLISEIIDNNQHSYKLMGSTTDYLTNKLKEKTSLKIKKDIQNSIDYMIENNLDILNIYDTFYKYDKNNLRKVLNVYGKDYLSSLRVNYNINIYPLK